MDEIQKVLVKAGRKDLAQKYYEKIAARKKAEEVEEEDTPEIADYRKLLNKLKGKEGIKKLKVFLDNPRLRKPIRFWLTKLDEGEGAGPIDFNEMIKQMKLIIKRDLPAARWLKMVLDYGISNGHVALDRILSKDKAKMTLLKEQV